MAIDLHMHSHYSDGMLSPARLVRKCRDKGLEIMSLTDHENAGGILAAKRAADKLGIKFIPGMEFTSVFRGQEHHILGYFIDRKSRCLKKFLAVWRESKLVQIKKMIEKLHQFGFDISFDEVMARTRGSVDRYHISLAMFPGFEKSVEAREEQKAFFRKYLLEKSVGGQGLAFVDRDKPDIRAVIDIIHDSKGLAFWAHPFWKIKEASVIHELILTFRKMGLDGIEVLYPFHSQEQVLFLHKIASDLSMYESCGSDFHREDNSLRQIANFQTFGIEINHPFLK